jgi:hypothetical protein
VTELTSPGVLSGRYQLVEPWPGEDGDGVDRRRPGASRRVAVKVLRADLAEDGALRTRFRNEAVAAKVAHPNIVATYDTGDDDGTALHRHGAGERADVAAHHRRCRRAPRARRGAHREQVADASTPPTARASCTAT